LPCRSRPPVQLQGLRLSDRVARRRRAASAERSVPSRRCCTGSSGSSWPGRVARAHGRRIGGPRSPARRGRAGIGEDPRGQDVRRCARCRVPADPVHARPRAGRYRRHQIYNQKQGEFEVSLARSSPTWARRRDQPAPPRSRVPSSSDAERQVTIGRETHPLPDPFLVMATQNPIESDGPTPAEAQSTFHAQGARRLPERQRGVRHRGAMVAASRRAPDHEVSSCVSSRRRCGACTSIRR